MPMPKEKTNIGLIPMGNAPFFVAKVIQGHIAGYLRLNAEVLEPVEIPLNAFDEKRCQYNAGAILKSLENTKTGDCDKVIAILEEDLFIPIFTHVYGEAKQGGRFAVVSIFRLGEEAGGASPPFPLVCERAAKVAVHELGHLFNLSHCDDERCLMHFSGNLEHLDATNFYFCRYCAAFFRDAVR